MDQVVGQALGTYRKQSAAKQPAVKAVVSPAATVASSSIAAE